MGRAPCCDKAKVKRGPWSPEEDTTLRNYLERHGTGGNWIALPQKAGLKRCGKSCRLRWLNYLRPDIKHGGFTEEEDNIICTLYRSIGSRWSVIASNLQGRTDNDVKNHWNTKLKKKIQRLSSGSDGSSISTITAATPSSQPSPTTLQTIKTEPFVYGGFSMPMESKPAFTPPSFGADQAPATNFAGVTSNWPYAVSPSAQDISAASSSLTVDNNSYGYMDGFLMEMGFEPSSELVNWYGFHDRIAPDATTTTSSGSNPTDVSNLWATVESKPPQGTHESLTYL